LTIAEGDDGRVLLHCHAGCTPEAIVSALGLTLHDLMPPVSPSRKRPSQRASSGSNDSDPRTVFKTAAEAVAELERRHGPRSASWLYQNVERLPVGVVVRWDRPGGGKDIRPVARKGSGWIIGGMPTPRPLYDLPALVDARRVYITEGEKAADAVGSVGPIATTSPHGSQSASSADWSPLAGKECIILPDHDDAGRKYAADVVALLAKLTPAPTVKIVELPDLPPGGDAVEFVEARDSRTNDEIRAEIEALANSVEPIELADVTRSATPVPVLVRLSDVRAEPIRWLWPGRIAVGKLTLIAGDPGLGKSFLTLDIAARVSSGTPWPDSQDTANPAGGVVLLSAEDDLADTIRPRLDAAGADVFRIVFVSAVRAPNPDTGGTRPVPFTLSADLPALEEAIEHIGGCRLVVIDPISAYLGGGPRFDSHRNSDVRTVLAPLADLAARRGVAIVAVTHLRKGEGPAMYRAMGSLAFVAAARAVWAVARDKDDPTGRRRLFLPVKNNLAGDQTGLAFALGQAASGVPCVGWEPEPISISADDALSADRPADDDGGSALDEAVEWLREALADGPVQAKDVKRQARWDAIAPRTLDRAKAQLKVIAAPDGYRGPWVWRLPNTPTERHSAPESPQCASLSGMAHSGSVGALCDYGVADRGCPDGKLPPEDCLEKTTEAQAADGDEWGEI